MLTRLGMAIFLSMNVMVFTFVLWSNDAYTVAPQPGAAAAWTDLLQWLCLVLSLPVLILLGLPLLRSALADVRGGVTSTDLLILAGVAAAYASSALAVVRGSGDIYFEVGCMVLVFVTLGRWLEATARLRASDALDALQDLLPTHVTVESAAGLRVIARQALSVGDTLVVRPNERIPADGELLTGPATLDEQVLTGESWPRTRHIGETVQGGSLNLESETRIRVTARPDEGTLARLIDAVRRARLAKGRSQQLAERVAGVFLPLVAGIALATFVGHGVMRGWDAGLMASLSVLLVACPCALGLATPLAAWSALGRAARSRIVFRSCDVLERLAVVRLIRFDKTGTLTTGRPRILRVHAADDVQSVRRMAVPLARSSHHAFCEAIRAEEPGHLVEVAVTYVRERPGLGVSGQVISAARDNGNPPVRVFLGSERWMKQHHLAVPARLRSALDQEEAAGHPTALVGWDRLVRGIFVFEETLRPEAALSLAACRDLGLEAAVLTGDSPGRGRRIEEVLGIPVLAGLQPEQKVEHIQQARRSGAVAMVGDGINDAPALSAADVGIALGCGTDVARDSADVCLLGDDLRQIPWAVRLSRQTVTTIRQNLAWAFGYNGLAVLAATTGRLHPALAAGLMLVSSVIVIANSLRLNRFEPVIDSQQRAEEAPLWGEASRVDPPGECRPPLRNLVREDGR